VPQAVLHKGLRILVPKVGENHVGLSVAWRTVDILPRRELDPISRLPLEDREEIII
jgi:hypothetical protein